jgi:hypothetical protein
MGNRPEGVIRKEEEEEEEDCQQKILKERARFLELCSDGH